MLSIPAAASADPGYNVPETASNSGATHGTHGYLGAQGERQSRSGRRHGRRASRCQPADRHVQRCRHGQRHAGASRFKRTPVAFEASATRWAGWLRLARHFMDPHNVHDGYSEGDLNGYLDGYDDGYSRSRHPGAHQIPCRRHGTVVVRLQARLVGKYSRAAMPFGSGPGAARATHSRVRERIASSTEMAWGGPQVRELRSSRPAANSRGVSDVMGGMVLTSARFFVLLTLFAAARLDCPARRTASSWVRGSCLSRSCCQNCAGAVWRRRGASSAHSGSVA